MSLGLSLRLFAILLAMLQPIVILCVMGTDVVSISSVWGTSLQPLFVITNAITSFFLYSHKKWVPSSLLLLLLTAFSVNLFPTLHNCFAYAFFFVSFIALLEKERYGIYPVLYLASLIFWFKKGFFWMEFWSIYVICIYHLNLLYLRYKYEHRN